MSCHFSFRRFCSNVFNGTCLLFDNVTVVARQKNEDDDHDELELIPVLLLLGTGGVVMLRNHNKKNAYPNWPCLLCSQTLDCPYRIPPNKNTFLALFLGANEMNRINKACSKKTVKWKSDLIKLDFSICLLQVYTVSCLELRYVNMET